MDELTREVVEQFVGEVKVYSSERVEIVFNFADEYSVIKERVDAFNKSKRKKKD